MIKIKINVLFLLFVLLMIGIGIIAYVEYCQVNKLRTEVEELEKIVVKNDLRFIQNEEKISIIEQSLEPKNRRWAKIKQVRTAIRDELKQNVGKKLQINEITEIASSLVDYSEEYEVKLSLLLAIARRESHFNPLAVSRTNAQGVMQLVFSTAKECAEDVGKKYFNIFKIRDNIQLGSWYIWKMLNRFKNNEELAIRAYNAGPVLVEKVLSGEIMDYPNETKKYVIDVMESKKKYEERGL